MKVLLAVDGSKDTKKMLAYLTRMRTYSAPRQNLWCSMCSLPFPQVLPNLPARKRSLNTIEPRRKLCSHRLPSFLITTT